MVSNLFGPVTPVQSGSSSREIDSQLPDLFTAVPIPAPAPSVGASSGPSGEDAARDAAKSVSVQSSAVTVTKPQQRKVSLSSDPSVLFGGPATAQWSALPTPFDMHPPPPFSIAPTPTPTPVAAKTTHPQESSRFFPVLGPVQRTVSDPAMSSSVSLDTILMPPPAPKLRSCVSTAIFKGDASELFHGSSAMPAAASLFLGAQPMSAPGSGVTLTASSGSVVSANRSLFADGRDLLSTNHAPADLGDFFANPPTRSTKVHSAPNSGVGVGAYAAVPGASAFPSGAYISNGCTRGGNTPAASADSLFSAPPPVTATVSTPADFFSAAPVSHSSISFASTKSLEPFSHPPPAPNVDVAGETAVLQFVSDVPSRSSSHHPGPPAAPGVKLPMTAIAPVNTPGSRPHGIQSGTPTKGVVRGVSTSVTPAARDVPPGLVRTPHGLVPVPVPVPDPTAWAPSTPSTTRKQTSTPLPPEVAWEVTLKWRRGTPCHRPTSPTWLFIPRKWSLSFVDQHLCQSHPPYSRPWYTRHPSPPNPQPQVSTPI